MSENNTTDSDITRLDEKEALDLLATTSLGRLVVRRSDDVDLFPLNFVVSDGRIYFRTAEGTKLFTLAEIDSKVLFESDHVDTDAEGNPAQAWSVIVKGTARVLTGSEEIHEAESLPLKPWLPTLKYNFVEINPTEVSGRRFDLGEEPERY
ncbi:MAG TPA: pyridoxamine 5'-phosphate oxidase family protein [Candidatus Corynebacterium avicola]|uniref:Pyridoxamine 5'-phosphate oxidase family protein n=1 Tax=Candidatus Corynebacterium avicola TaxID=2838527 RepID=A0A9D1UL21_9CORY|nr:pyridoxamine 5'-phosphate oxidase family protein [Candidatus Corynebacterium avicola]